MFAVRGGYVTHYWSPEGDHFKSREEIQQHVDKNQLSVDMAGFDAADINVRETEKQGETLFLPQQDFFQPGLFFQGSSALLQR